MAPLLKQTATFAHDEYDICVLNGGQSVRNCDHGPALSRSFKGRLYEPLALRVQRARGLVKQEDARVANKSAGDTDTLPLSAGERHAVRADVGVVTLGEGGHKVVDRGVTAYSVELILCHIIWIKAEENIVPNCTCGSQYEKTGIENKRRGRGKGKQGKAKMRGKTKRAENEKNADLA